MNSTTKPVPTDVVINKFFNGFMNAFILENNWISNIEDKDAEDYDLDFLISVWKAGTAFGMAYREHRRN